MTFGHPYDIEAYVRRVIDGAKAGWFLVDMYLGSEVHIGRFAFQILVCWLTFIGDVSNLTTVNEGTKFLVPDLALSRSHGKFIQSQLGVLKALNRGPKDNKSSFLCAVGGMAM